MEEIPKHHILNESIEVRVFSLEQKTIQNEMLIAENRKTLLDAKSRVDKIVSMLCLSVNKGSLNDIDEKIMEAFVVKFSQLNSEYAYMQRIGNVLMFCGGLLCYAVVNAVTSYVAKIAGWK